MKTEIFSLFFNVKLNIWTQIFEEILKKADFFLSIHDMPCIFQM